MGSVTPSAEHQEQSKGDPVTEMYKRDVDRTLLRENLKRSPQARVEALIALQRLAREALEAGKRLRGH